MYHEDDTFNRLRRTPIHEVTDLVIHLNKICADDQWREWNEKRIKLLNSHGWTLDEWIEGLTNYTKK